MGGNTAVVKGKSYAEAVEGEKYFTKSDAQDPVTIMRSLLATRKRLNCNILDKVPSFKSLNNIQSIM